MKMLILIIIMDKQVGDRLMTMLLLMFTIMDGTILAGITGVGIILDGIDGVGTMAGITVGHGIMVGVGTMVGAMVVFMEMVLYMEDFMVTVDLLEIIVTFIETNFTVAIEV
jgi:hypothetical protein